MTEPSTPCEGMEKFDFDVQVNLPDPNGRRPQDRKQARVVAAYQGEEAGELFYGVGPGDNVLVTRMETVEKYRCRGCATQMRDALAAAFPDYTLRDGGNSNSDVGDVVVAKWVDRGVLAVGL